MKTILKIFLTLLTLFLFACEVHKTPPEIEWYKTYGGKFDDWGIGVIQTKERGFILGANTNSIDSNNYFFCIISTDENGEKQLQKNFNLHGSNIANIFMQKNDEKFLAGGWMYSSKNDIDSWILNFDNTGKIIWYKDIGGFQNDFIKSISSTNDKGVLSLYTTNSKGSGKNDLWLIKMNQNGTIQWDRTYGDFENETAYDVCQTKDSNIYILATHIGQNNSRDLWLIKTDKTGEMIWEKSFGGDNDEIGAKILRTKYNDLIIAATVYYKNQSSKVWIIKIDKRGNIKWNLIWGDAEKNEITNFIQTKDNAFVFVGNTYNKDQDIFILKVSAKGKILWYKTIDTGADETVASIVQTYDGGYAIIGSLSDKKDKKNCLLIKLSTDK